MSVTHDRHFHAEIQKQNSLESAAQVLAECGEALGWDLIAFHAYSDQATLPRARDGSFIATKLGWPASCVEEWVSRGLGRDCPVGHYAARVTEPFLWEWDPQQTSWFGRKLAPEQTCALKLYGQHVAGGVAVPVRRAGGKSGYVSWTTRNAKSLRSKHEATFSSTYLLSHTFIYHLDQLTANAGSAMAEPALTARELECLTWAARGKTEDEIGIIIERSHETVHFHLRNAVLKLDARNRAHAIAIACTRGLICVR